MSSEQEFPSSLCTPTRQRLQLGCNLCSNMHSGTSACTHVRTYSCTHALMHALSGGLFVWAASALWDFYTEPVFCNHSSDAELQYRLWVCCISSLWIIYELYDPLPPPPPPPHLRRRGGGRVRCSIPERSEEEMSG